MEITQVFDKKYRGWLLAHLLLAFAVRVYQLGNDSLWFDEAHTWRFANLSWRELLLSLRGGGVHPPVYFIGARIAGGLAGNMEWALRWLSVCCDTLAVAM